MYYGHWIAFGSRWNNMVLRRLCKRRRKGKPGNADMPLLYSPGCPRGACSTDSRTNPLNKGDTRIASLLLTHGCVPLSWKSMPGGLAAGAAAFGRIPGAMIHKGREFVNTPVFPFQSAPLSTSFSTKAALMSATSVTCHCAQPQ